MNLFQPSDFFFERRRYDARGPSTLPTLSKQTSERKYGFDSVTLLDHKDDPMAQLCQLINSSLENVWSSQKGWDTFNINEDDLRSIAILR